MKNKEDYYSLLGVNRNASPEEIRRAFISAAKRYHPDKNSFSGEIEIFLEIKEAYEILVDPDKRGRYDLTLPMEVEKNKGIDCKYSFSRLNLQSLDEPQLVYVMMEFSIPDQIKSLQEPSLNLCLVVDRSTSMQGKNIDVVKNTAIRIMQKLKNKDAFSVIAFNDKAEIVIPATLGNGVQKMEAYIQKLQPFGGTEIFSGLKTGLDEIQKNVNASKVNHLILLTDGHTYGDEEKCIKLARQAAEMGVRISCLGVGTEWNDNFLDQLAVLTGGSSMFISLAQDIQTAMFEKFSQLGKIYADESKLEYKKTDGIDIRYAFRVQPEANLLKTDNPIFLGPVFTNNTLKILLEFFITPEIIKNQTLLNFFNGQFSTSILGSSISFETFPIVLSLPIANEHPIIPPREILDALSQIRFYRLQDQARQEINDGSYDQAADHLTMLATHLLSQGKKNLAKTVLIEVENIQNKKTLSKQGSKEIKYGTKALLGIGKQEG